MRVFVKILIGIDHLHIKIMDRIKLFIKRFIILFISVQIVNLLIVYFKTKDFVFEITSVQTFIIIFVIGLIYNISLIYKKKN